MPATIRFGNFEVRPGERQLLLDGVATPLGGRAFGLLLVLIEERDRVVSKTELLERVWPGVVVEENNLQVQISALRKLLGAQSIATVAGRGYRFALPVAADAAADDATSSGWSSAGAQPTVTYLFTDIEGSTRLWEQQPRAMQVAMAQHDALCRELVARHGGRIVKLTGDGIHAVFLQPEDAIGTAVALQLALAERQPAEPPLRVRIGMHRGSDEYRDGDFYGPAVNRAARVMSAAHGGQVLLSQAVAEAVESNLPAGVALRDLGSVRLRDLSGPERLFQVLHARLRAEFPPLRSLEATPNNLPQQLNSFIGREQEIADVGDLLGQHRLVTLLAMGGIGKSRLAVQLGASLIDAFSDGVWLVELAPVTDPLAVAQTLASVLGLREEPGATLAESLLRHLQERELLILLDNCEHLIDACAQLAKTLLQGTTRLKILATSRDPLNIAGEASYPLRPLAVPAPGQVAPQELLRHESVRLFVDRARAAQAPFRLDEANAAAVAEICSRLDGIPLAIELAAARVRVMTPQAIAARLDQRFKLLVAGDRTVLPRQKTLRALIDWSYDLLPPEEASLFARLSVFAAGWTLEAAEQVCGFDRIDESDVLFLLANLVQKSLVVLDTDNGRYRMLETVREFAREKLEASGSTTQVRARCVGFFLELTDAALPHLLGAEQAEWLSRLDAERENLWAVLAWCSDGAGGASQGLRLVKALKHYWLNRGLLGQGLRLLQAVLAHPQAQERGLERCSGLADAGQICYFMGRYAEARAYLRESLSIARKIDQPMRLLMVLQSLVMVEVALGDIASGLTYCDEALAIARERNDRRGIAGTVNSKGQLLRMQGDLSAAREQFEAARQLASELGDREAEAIALLNLSMVAIGRSDEPRAVGLLRQVLQAVDLIGSRVVGQSLLDVLAARASMRAQWDTSARLYGAAEALAQQTSIRRDPADQMFVDSMMDPTRKALGSDFSLHEEAGRATSFDEAMAFARQCLETDTRLS